MFSRLFNKEPAIPAFTDEIAGMSGASPDGARSTPSALHGSGAGTAAAAAAPFEGLFDPEPAGRGAAQEFMIEQWRRQGVENPEAQAQDAAAVNRHMSNIQQFSAQISALGGVPPSLDDLRLESQPYVVVMRQYIKQLQQYPSTEAGRRGIPMPNAPRWAKQQPAPGSGLEEIGEDAYRKHPPAVSPPATGHD